MAEYQERIFDRVYPPSGDLPSLDLERCTRCGDCVTACPVAALTLDSDRAA